ncbi:MAG: hypothetical protein ACT4O5_14615 [Gammaproteobacteria bacterium]
MGKRNQDESGERRCPRAACLRHDDRGRAAAEPLATEIPDNVEDDPTAVEIRAAASAAAGDFAAATTDQTRAIELAKKLGWDLAPQEERLARYRANQPWYGDLLGITRMVEPI